jgi:hypothetical protein
MVAAKKHVPIVKKRMSLTPEARNSHLSAAILLNCLPDNKARPPWESSGIENYGQGNHKGNHNGNANGRF